VKSQNPFATEDTEGAWFDRLTMVGLDAFPLVLSLSKEVPSLAKRFSDV
jgi:hypothetical protein